MALILDTGVLLSALDRRERRHADCRALLDDCTELRVIPSPVLPELDYLATERLGVGAMLALLQDIDDSVFVVEEVTFEDFRRIRTLMDTYADLDIGFVDAAVMAITERYDESKLATLDRRHFSAIRPRHCDALDLLPA